MRSLSGSQGSWQVYHDPDFRPTSGSAGYRGRSVLLCSCTCQCMGVNEMAECPHLANTVAIKRS